MRGFATLGVRPRRDLKVLIQIMSRPRCRVQVCDGAHVS
jgi:hypothetical protein